MAPDYEDQSNTQVEYDQDQEQDIACAGASHNETIAQDFPSACLSFANPFQDRAKTAKLIITSTMPANATMTFNDSTHNVISAHLSPLSAPGAADVSLNVMARPGPLSDSNASLKRHKWRRCISFEGLRCGIAYPNLEHLDYDVQYIPRDGHSLFHCFVSILEQRRVADRPRSHKQMRQAIANFYDQNVSFFHSGVEYPIPDTTTSKIRTDGYGCEDDVMAFSVMYSIPIELHKPETYDSEQFSSEIAGEPALLLHTLAWDGETRRPMQDHWQVLSKIPLTAAAISSAKFTTALKEVVGERTALLAKLRNLHRASFGPPSLDPTKLCMMHGGSVVEDVDACLVDRNWQPACLECKIDDGLISAEYKRQLWEQNPKNHALHLRRLAAEESQKAAAVAAPASIAPHDVAAAGQASKKAKNDAAVAAAASAVQTKANASAITGPLVGWFGHTAATAQPSPSNAQVKRHS